MTAARFAAAALLALAAAGSASAQAGWNKKKDLPPPPASAGAAGVERVRDDAPAALKAAIDDPARPAADRARDRYRHPGATLGFWRIKPGDTVVDLQPGGGYWTAILAPYLRATHGRYVAGGGPGGRDAFLAKYADKARYGDVEYVIFNKASPAFLPAGTADVVISSRELHNWMRGGMLDKGMADAFAALKPGGVFAVEEHRADGSSVNAAGSAGYVRTSDAVAAAQKAGFRLDAASEVNANKADTKDHPFGVWTLPPSRQSTADGKTADPAFDHAKYDAIGESDRMTLRFVKPLTDTRIPTSPASGEVVAVGRRRGRLDAGEGGATPSATRLRPRRLPRKGKGRVVLAVVLALAAAAPAHAVERLVPARRLLPYFDFYLGMAEARRDRFRPAYQVLVDGKPYAGAVALVDGDRRIPLALGPDGRFDQFPTLAQLKRRPMLALEAGPHARIRSDLGVEALGPRGETLATAPLRQALDQLNAALKSSAGVLSFVVPRFGRAFFIFGGRKGVAVAADGAAQPLPLGEDEPVEPFWSPRRQPSAVAVRFPVAPARVMLVPGS